MMPASAINEFGRGNGVTCNLLDIDYESSKGRACYLAWQFPQNKWAQWVGTKGAPTEPIDCS